MKVGDLIGFSGANVVSDIINVGTWGIPRYSLSHVGIVGEHDRELVLFESTTLDTSPCIIQGKPFKGTQAQNIADRIASYNGKVWHYPLSRYLYSHEANRLNGFLHTHIGIPYDEIGAFRACDHFAWWEQFLHPENLSSIFCSEWCAAAHNEIGIFPTADASRWSPNHLVREERWFGVIHRPSSLN